MIWLLGERVERGQGKNVVPAVVLADQRPLEHKVVTTQVFFLFVLLHTQSLLPRQQ